MDITSITITSSGRVSEYEPVCLTNNTEVKFPVTMGNNQQLDSNTSRSECTLDDLSQFTQYACGNSDDVFLQSFNRLVGLYRDLPKDMFIANLLQEFASNEQELEATRIQFYESLKSHEDFPFHVDSELKRRVFTRKGDPVSVKLANDIHALLSVMEGDDYCVLKDMISTSKRRTLSQVCNTDNTQQSDYTCNSRNGCKCRNEVVLLRDTVSSIQAEMLLLKQSVNASNQLRSDQVKAISDTVQSIKSDVTRYAKEFGELVERVSSSTGGDFRVIVKTLSETLDQRISSIEKFLDGENIHVVSVAPDRNGGIFLPNCGCVLPNCGCVRQPELTNPVCNDAEVEKQNLFGNVRIPATSTNSNRLIDIDVSELEQFLLGDEGSVRRDAGSQKEPNKTAFATPDCRSGALRQPSQHKLKECDSTNEGYVRIERVGKDIVCADKGKPIPVRVTTRSSGTQTDDYVDFSVASERVRRRSKRFYVGGYDETVTTDYVSRFVSKKGPKVTLVRIFPSRKDNKVTIRLNVEADSNADLVLQRGFWPRGVICRPWMSRAVLRRRRDSARNSVREERDDGYRRRYRTERPRNTLDNIETYNRYTTLDGEVD